jgi:hypothetical protein
MLHASILCGSSGLDNALQSRIDARAARPGLGPETTDPLLRSREYARELRVFDLAMANNMAGAKTLSSAQVVPYAPD